MSSIESETLAKAIEDTTQARKALVGEMARGSGKSRQHAETFVAIDTALEKLKAMQEKPRAAKKKPAVK